MIIPNVKKVTKNFEGQKTIIFQRKWQGQMDSKDHKSLLPTFSILKLPRKPHSKETKDIYCSARRENAVYWESFLSLHCDKLLFQDFLSYHLLSQSLEHKWREAAVLVLSPWEVNGLPFSILLPLTYVAECQDPWALSYSDRIIYCHGETHNDGAW